MLLTSPLTKEAALGLYGGDAQALAVALGITRSAVYQWKDGEPIPDKQDLRLRHEILPQRFAARASDSAKATTDHG